MISRHRESKNRDTAQAGDRAADPAVRPGRADKPRSRRPTGIKTMSRALAGLSFTMATWSCSWTDNHPGDAARQRTHVVSPRLAVILMPGLSAAEADRLLRSSSLDEDPTRTPRLGRPDEPKNQPDFDGRNQGEGRDDHDEPEESARPHLSKSDPHDKTTLRRIQAPRMDSGLVWARRGLWIRRLVADETGITTVTTVDALTGRTPAVHGVWGRRFRRFDKPVHADPTTLLADPIWVEALHRNLGLVTWDLRLAGSCSRAGSGHQCFGPAGLRTSRAGNPELEPQPQNGPTSPESALARSAPLPQPPAPKAMTIWATATGPDQARIWIQGPEAVSSPHRLRVGQWAQGSIAWQAQGQTGSQGVFKHSNTRAHIWMRLLKADPKTGRTRLWVSRIRPLLLPRSWWNRPHRTTATEGLSPPTDRETDPMTSLSAPPLVEPRLLVQGRMDRTTYAQAVLLSGPNLVAFSRILARKHDWNLAIVSWTAFADLARGLASHPNRPDLTAADIPILRNLLHDGRRRLDQFLGRSIAVLTSAGIRVLVLSTGGLEPVKTKLLVGSLIRHIAPRTKMVSQGSTALIYLSPDQRSAGGADKIRRALEQIDIQGTKPFGAGSRILTRPRFPRTLRGGQSPDMIIQAAPGFALSGRRSRKRTVWPTEAAVDGQSPTAPSRDGFAFVVGPGIHPEEIAELTAPCIAALLGRFLELEDWPENKNECIRARIGKRPLSPQRRYADKGTHRGPDSH